MGRCHLVPNCFECVASQLYQNSALKTTPHPLKSKPNKPQIDSFLGKIRACLRQAQLARPARSLCLLLPLPTGGSVGSASRVPKGAPREGARLHGKAESILIRRSLSPAGFKSSRNEESLSLAGLLEKKAVQPRCTEYPPAAHGKQE